MVGLHGPSVSRNTAWPNEVILFFTTDRRKTFTMITDFMAGNQLGRLFQRHFDCFDDGRQGNADVIGRHGDGKHLRGGWRSAESSCGRS